MQPKKILIVDDEPYVLDTFSTFFKNFGYDVRVVLTCEEGLKAAEEIQPDLLIIEYRLSGIGGLEFVRSVRAKHQKMQVFVLTTGAKDDIEPEFSELSIFRIFEKPISLKTLLEGIQESLKS